MLKIDPSKFSIHSVVWSDGNPYDPPGYMVFIKTEGVEGVFGCLIQPFSIDAMHNNVLKPEWVLKEDNKDV